MANGFKLTAHVKVPQYMSPPDIAYGVLTKNQSVNAAVSTLD